MKQFFLPLVLAFAATCALHAQQISVVSPAGVTSVFTDLNLAIQGAEVGSTVYLSGGGFQVSDNTRITKKLSIIGIGHRPDNDNADGSTNISGNLFFDGGADNSVLMGVYMSGDVNIATSSTALNNFLLRFCNINSVQVKNGNCQNILINQNYIRSNSNGGNAAISFTNNVLHSLNALYGAIIDHNIITSNASPGYYSWCGFNASGAIANTHNSQITNNILIAPSNIHCGSNCVISNNMTISAWGENSLQTSSWAEVFGGTTNYAISPNTDFHIAADQAALTAATDGGQVGIYGGTGFSDKALPPGPRIISKKVADQTDADGNLHVEIQVSAE